MDSGINQPFEPQFADLLLIWCQLSRSPSVTVLIYEQAVLFQVCFDSLFCVAGGPVDLITQIAF